MLKVQKCFRVFFTLHTNFENSPKVFYRSRRICPKYLIVFRDCFKSLLEAYKENRAILEWFYFYKVISENPKRILACTENALKGYKRLRRIRQEYFADGHKTEPISTNFCQKPKIQILNPLPKHGRMGKKPSHTTVPLKRLTLDFFSVFRQIGANGQLSTFNENIQ